jgi:xanthine dehydrogenase accessory factor
MRDWRTVLVACMAEGPVVLVTVIATEGSTPREVGARMIVGTRAVHGSIGGGQLEFQETLAAHVLLARTATYPNGHHETHRIILGPDAGQCCGGVVEVSQCLIATMAEAEAMIAASPTAARRVPVLLYGAGHIARALVRVLDELPLALHWIDIAPERFPDVTPDGVSRIVSDQPASVAAAAQPGSVHLVMTHSHDLDAAICEALLRRNDFAFLGLIGSKTKRARFVQRFDRAGIDAAVRQRLTCPIGLPDVKGKTPPVIAIAVAAQLLALPSMWSDDLRA